MEVRGFEPLTFCMPCRRATNCAIPPKGLVSSFPEGLPNRDNNLQHNSPQMPIDRYAAITSVSNPLDGESENPEFPGQIREHTPNCDVSHPMFVLVFCWFSREVAVPINTAVKTGHSSQKSAPHLNQWVFAVVRNEFRGRHRRLEELRRKTNTCFCPVCNHCPEIWLFLAPWQIVVHMQRASQSVPRYLMWRWRYSQLRDTEGRLFVRWRVFAIFPLPE